MSLSVRSLHTEIADDGCGGSENWAGPKTLVADQLSGHGVIVGMPRALRPIAVGGAVFFDNPFLDLVRY